jgi:hypothetical protein
MESVVERQRCAKCGVEKGIEEFHVDRSNPHGRKYACRPCTNKVKAKWRSENAIRVRKQKSDHYARNRDKYLAYQKSDARRENLWRWKLKTQFSMTEEDWQEAWDSQGGKCAICGCEPHNIANRGWNRKNLCIDHDHASGMFRGLLCHECNTGLGFFKDSVHSLVFAIEYLETASKRVRNEAETT